MKNLTQNIRSISGIIVTLGLLLAGSIQEVSAQAAANAPKLTTTIQDHGNPGAIIQVNGTNLNRGSNGLTWAGQAPYAVQMTGQNGQPVNCTFRFINIGRIDVTIPATAISSRIRLVQGGYTSLINRSIRVTRAIPAGKGVLTIDNLSQYNILGVQLNGAEQLPANIGFLVKTAGELTLSPGQYRVRATLGTFDRNNPFFFSEQIINVTNGGRHLMSVARVTIAQLMTNFRVSGDWNSDLVFGNDNAFHIRSVRFNSNGTYTLRELRAGNVVVNIENSTYAELNWPDNSIALTFRLGNRTVSLFSPFAQFVSTVGRNNQNLTLTRQ